MTELFEYWQLLLVPLFFGLGWAAARVDIRQVVHESRALPRSYFQGLNFLLNEQPDKAIDSFLEVAKVDSQTVELHFALCDLFRRHCETKRAIRMHQNLIDRPDLDEGVRLHALSELGHERFEDRLFLRRQNARENDFALQNFPIAEVVHLLRMAAARTPSLAAPAPGRP